VASAERETDSSRQSFDALGIRFVWGTPKPNERWVARVGFDEGGDIFVEVDKKAIAAGESEAIEAGLESGSFARATYGEEIIHGDHPIALRNEWIRAGRQGTFTEFVQAQGKALFDDIRNTVSRAAPAGTPVELLVPAHEKTGGLSI
jgi:hypothetical protein